MTDINKAAGILIVDRKILVGRTKGKSVFVGVGGKIQEGETAKLALVRELNEELQITVQENDLEEFGTFTAQAAYDPDKIVSMTVFLVKSWQGEINPSQEVEEILWINSHLPKDKEIGSIFEHEVIPKLKAQNLID